MTGTIDFTWRDGAPRLTLTGDIDIEVVDDVTDTLLAEYQTAGPLAVDARRVTFVDSVGIGLLLRLRQIAASVQLVEPPDEVMRVLQLCGVADLFEIDSPAA